jgi:glucose-6-phosphate 1-dehydrogenase
MSKGTEPEIGVTLVIFGASGDLTYRKLIPAINALNLEKELPEQFSVVGVARTKFSDDEFRNHLYKGVQEFSRIKPHDDKSWMQTAKELTYLQGEYDQQVTYQHLKQKLEGLNNPNWLFYLATSTGNNWSIRKDRISTCIY